MNYIKHTLLIGVLGLLLTACHIPSLMTLTVEWAYIQDFRVIPAYTESQIYCNINDGKRTEHLIYHPERYEILVRVDNVGEWLDGLKDDKNRIGRGLEVMVYRFRETNEVYSFYIR